MFAGLTKQFLFVFLTAFPDKLHEMLLNESSDDPASAIVSWLPHGRAFIVRKPKEFTTEIMPKYVFFRMCILVSCAQTLCFSFSLYE